METLILLIKNATLFIQNFVTPLFFSIAFVVFSWNVFQLFAQTDAANMKNRRDTVLYSIGALVIIIIFWGVIEYLVSGLGFSDTSTSITPDYLNATQ